MNLSNYFFRTHSVVLALHFMHEFREISGVRFMPKISLDKYLTLNSIDIIHNLIVHDIARVTNNFDYSVMVENFKICPKLTELWIFCSSALSISGPKVPGSES